MLLRINMFQWLSATTDGIRNNIIGTYNLVRAAANQMWKILF